jgi:hypothetical protein
MEFSDGPKAPEVVYYTPEEIGKLIKLHPGTVRRLFIDEEGVLRLGHGPTRRKRQYYTLRIPARVLDRVLLRLTGGQK